MSDGLSASGARIRGDDYQHLFAWIQVLHALQPGSRVLEVGIEDPSAGNADDVTLYKEDQRREYFQVKSSVDARKVAGIDWLIEPSKENGPSIIQGFYRLWKDAPDQQKPKLSLVTNRLVSGEDAVMSMRDGRDGTVARKLGSSKPKSKARRALRCLAGHLRASEEEVIAFLHDVRFIVGRLFDEWVDEAATLMYAAGLRNDKDAVTRGISIVRGWVTSGKRRLPVAELQEATEPLKRPQELPTASLLMQVLDRDPLPENALIALDWVDYFPGNEPRTRRRPTDDALWNEQFRPQLQRVARELKTRGCTDVLVRGYMRLPTWFATGVELGRTAGFNVVSFQSGEPWPSKRSGSKP